ncbi:MAG: hypothetical protein WCK48_00520 [bacterium]
MTIFSYFFLIVILPFAWFEVGRGYARPDDKLENGTFYRVLGQPHCWQQDGKNECVAILQEGDGNTRLYNIKGKTLENIPTYFIWRSNGRVMEKLPPSLK